ncbi:MAG: hypothetical protein GTO41_14665 [Burkholderiales bacterium]|nr:hypothetical protein [Burkholderiales bacterium]
MAKAISSEELQLRKRARRRLVGAIALVVFVVVFVPMVLDNEPKPVSQDIAINISPPSPDVDASDGTLVAEPEPLSFQPVQPSGAEAVAKLESGKQADTAREDSEPARRLTAVEEKPVTRSQNGPSTVAAKERFVVQLGAFSNAENASRLAATVRENRFSAYTEVVSTSGGNRTRVRVGPYPTRSAAEEASQRLKARKLTYGEPAIVRLTD